MKEYIDVRGPHPIYFRGNNYVRLVGCNRGISIQDAMVWIMTHGSIEDYMSVSWYRIPINHDYVNHVDRRQGKS